MVVLGAGTYRHTTAFHACTHFSRRPDLEVALRFAKVDMSTSGWARCKIFKSQPVVIKEESIEMLSNRRDGRLGERAGSRCWLINGALEVRSPAFPLYRNGEPG